MRIYAGHTGEMRAIELEELPKEIPIAKRSASEALLVVSPISNIDVENYVLEEKKSAPRHNVCRTKSGVDRGRGNVHDGGGSQIEKFEDFRPERGWCLSIEMWRSQSSTLPPSS
jgi:hypothetical protein